MCHPIALTDVRVDLTPVDGRRTDLGRIGTIATTEGIRVLMADSTNAEVPASGKKAEASVGPAMASIFATAPGRVIVTTFSSHIDRMQQVIDAAYRDGRVVGVVGRSMVRNVNIARNLGYLKAPDGVIISDKEIDKVPDDELVLLTKGFQGSFPRAYWAHLEGLPKLPRLLHLGDEGFDLGPYHHAAVELRRILGPSCTGCQPAPWAPCSSAGLQPPSGPQASHTAVGGDESRG